MWGPLETVSCDLVVVDCFGETLVLDHSNWQKHLSSGRHLEVVSYHDAFQRALEDPDVVIEAARDGHDHFYRRGLGQGRYASHYLVVVVANFPAGGKIVTWRFTRAIDTRGTQIWKRPMPNSSPP